MIKKIFSECVKYIKVRKIEKVKYVKCKVYKTKK